MVDTENGGGSKRLILEFVWLFVSAGGKRQETENLMLQKKKQAQVSQVKVTKSYMQNVYVENFVSIPTVVKRVFRSTLQ